MIAGNYINTTDATQTVAATLPTSDDRAYLVEARIIATETNDFDEIAGYIIIGVFANDGGTLSLVGSLNKTVVAETTSAWDATIDANARNIRVLVTGAASTNITWKTTVATQESYRYVPQIAVEPPAAPAETPIDVDVFIDMDVPDADGTTLTADILASGTNNGSPSWVMSGSTSGFTVGATATTRLSSVKVGVTTYNTGATSRTCRLLHDAAQRYGTLDIPSGKRKMSVGGFIHFAPAVTQWAFYDYWSIIGVDTGAFAVLQLRNPATYAVNLETNPGGSTTHSDDIVITPDTTYWCTMNADFDAGTAGLSIYEISEWTLVGSVTTTMATGEDIGTFRFGNAETGLSSGKTSYFENTILDYTDATYPLGP